MTRCRAFLPGLMVLLFSLPAAACLWDYDTLRDERRGLPGIAEVLAGRWEKHSQFFYENRVARMNALIAKEPANWPAYDNLAVALEKLGRIDDAIEIMLRKEKQNPAQYTTYANLGTFHLHKGEFDAGIDYIRKALAINPNAHFGREAYQLQLAEFLRDGQKNPQLVMSMNFLHIVHSNKVAPALYAALTQPATSPSTTQPGDYVSPIWAARGSPNAVAYALGRNDAFEGIVGIIRFGVTNAIAPDAAYVPAHIEGGNIIPGHAAPKR